MVPNDIAAYVSRRFAPGQQGNALRELASAVQSDGTPATAQMLRCALVNSGGQLATLQFELSWLASSDEDVILNAEFGRQNGAWTRLRDLSQPFSATD